MSEPRKIAEMIGEAMREGGVLRAVFGMLDKFLLPAGPSTGWTAAVLGTALAFFVAGIMMERQRQS